MRPVEQTQMVAGGGGNCVAACVASIFELPLTDCWPTIPNGGGYSEMCRWTQERHPALACCSRQFGHLEKNVVVEDYKPLSVVDWPFIPAGYWIALVISPRGVIDEHGRPSLHAVVMKGGELVWDPHPRRAMGVGPAAGMYWWVVRDPSKL